MNYNIYIVYIWRHVTPSLFERFTARPMFELKAAFPFKKTLTRVKKLCHNGLDLKHQCHY
jgi:hypothetical protein